MRPDTDSDEQKTRQPSDPKSAAERNAARDRLRLIKSRWAELRGAAG